MTKGHWATEEGPVHVRPESNVWCWPNIVSNLSLQPRKPIKATGHSISSLHRDFTRQLTKYQGGDLLSPTDSKR